MSQVDCFVSERFTSLVYGVKSYLSGITETIKYITANNDDTEANIPR